MKSGCSCKTLEAKSVSLDWSCSASSGVALSLRTPTIFRLAPGSSMNLKPGLKFAIGCTARL